MNQMIHGELLSASYSYDNLYILIKSDFLIGVTRTKRATLQIWGTPWAGVEVVVVAI